MSKGIEIIQGTQILRSYCDICGDRAGIDFDGDVITCCHCDREICWACNVDGTMDDRVLCKECKELEK